MLGTSVSAQAADLGGDCCADLEERVAELEATAAKKGNRKVSLKINGWVNEQVLFWDDSHESNIYVGANDQERSRFKFSGSAKIDGDWSAGFTLEVGVRTAQLSGANQEDDDAGATGLDIRKSSWFIKSKTYGSLTVGRDGSATYHLLDDANITNTRYYADAESLPTVGISGFLVTTDAGTSSLTWSSIMSRAANRSPGNGERPDIIRYNTPEFSGFSAVAAYGEDDMWDAALVYEKTHGDFELAFRIGYAEYTDEGSGPGSDHCYGPNGTNSANAGLKCREFGGSGTIWHKPTGLFVYGAYGQKEDNRDEAVALPTVDDEDKLYYIQAGIEKKWHPLGSTSIFATYRRDDVGTQNGSTLSAANEAVFGLGAGDFYINGTEINTWGAGVVQNISAAAMDLYLIYSNVDGEIDAVNKATGVSTKVDLDTFQMLQAGARIQF